MRETPRDSQCNVENSKSEIRSHETRNLESLDSRQHGNDSARKRNGVFKCKSGPKAALNVKNS
jgi:hypothetical protein